MAHGQCSHEPSIRPKTAVNLTLTREFEPYFDSPFPGEVMVNLSDGVAPAARLQNRT